MSDFSFDPKEEDRAEEVLPNGHSRGEYYEQGYSDHEIGPDQNIGTASREPRRTGYKTRIFFSDQTKVVK